jgi:hypothetical protein
MCSTIVFSNDYWTAFYAGAQWQRRNVLVLSGKDLDCMVEVKIRWFRLFCRRRNLVVDYRKLYAVSNPKPF